MGTCDTIGGTPQHDPEFNDPFAFCYALLKMHGHENSPEEYEECNGCPVQQCCLSYHQQMKLPLDVQTLFKDVMFQMNLKYKQHLPQKGHSWMGEKSSSMRKLLFAEFKEFKAAVFAAGTKEEDRLGELIDALLLGMMTAQQWIQELWKPMDNSDSEDLALMHKFIQNVLMETTYTKQEYEHSCQKWQRGGRGWDKYGLGATWADACVIWYQHWHKPVNHEWRPRIIMEAVLEAAQKWKEKNES